MTPRTFKDHLDPNITPKRILSLDGGGLRGVLTVAFLKKIEDILRERWAGGDQKFRLCDYYDLIGGTSTGSIIAAGLALGMSVDEIRAHYFKLGEDVFKPGFYIPVFSQQYDAEKVATALKGVFGDETLGSKKFKTGLLIMSKRLDTGSPWPLTNNPGARYFNGSSTKTTMPNKDYPLWSVVRASTAAPTFFDPESILIGAADEARGYKEVRGEFVDGGVSTANNPALQLVMTATVKGYGFGWEMGESNLSVTSVGTGRANPFLGLSTGKDALAALHGVKALKAVLEDCADLVETVMQWMSHSPTARSIDREMGTLEGSHVGAGPCLSYLRYNIHFEPDWFSKNLGMNLSRDALDDLAKMDRPTNMTHLEQIGQMAAERFVRPEHFAGL